MPTPASVIPPISQDPLRTRIRDCYLANEATVVRELIDGAAFGAGSYQDFKRFTGVISQLEGGVYFNIGSAVILPEVFLKAVSAVRNLGYTLQHFTTVNMDFIRHYRPTQNVVCRPTSDGGKGYTLIGHHELMLPLLAAAIIEEL